MPSEVLRSRIDPRTWVLAAIVALVAAGGVYWITAPPGALGLQPDSFLYVSSAWFLAHGEGLRMPQQTWTSPDTTRLTVWSPPGYPTAIAVGIRAGLDPFVSARLLQVAAAGITGALTVLTGALLGGFGAAALSALLLLGSPVFWELSVQALSDLCFLAAFTTWGYLVVRRRELRWPVALVLAVLPLLRYVGIGLIPATAWIAWRTPGTPRARLTRVVGTVAPALLLFGSWLVLRPTALEERTGGGLHLIVPNILGFPRHVVEALVYASVPIAIPVRTYFGLMAWVFVALLWWRVLRDDPEGTRWQQERLVAGVVGLLMVLLPTSFFVDGAVSIGDPRHTMPIMLVLMFGIGLGVARFWAQSDRRTRGTLLVMALVWGGAASVGTGRFVQGARRDPVNLASAAWRDAGPIRWVRAQQGAHTLYTNQPWALWLHTRRAARFVVPESVPAPDALRDTLARHDGYLVNLMLPWPAIEDVEPVARRAGLVLVERFPDGSVWRAP